MAPFNPPAFPCEAQGDRNVPPENDHLQTGIYSAKFPGMSLHDYFAGQAMAGDWSAQSPEVGEFNNKSTDEILFARAVLYYRMADAMLAARAGGDNA